MTGYALAAVGSGLAIVVAAVSERWLGLADLSLVFMLAVLIVASRTYTGPAVLTAVLCFLAYNYFFIEPRYSLYISASHGVATVALFLAAALLAGRLASQLSMQVQALRVAGRHARSRQELGQRLVVAADEEEVVHAAHIAFRQCLEADVWVRLDERELHAAGVEPPSLPALRRVEGLGEQKQQQMAETVEEFGWWFLPLNSPRGTMGVIGLKLPSYVDQLRIEQRQLARSMSDDISQALLRIRLGSALASERIANETERLRSALLSSVSHDLRTPLAGIIGAAGTLEVYGKGMEDGDRSSLLETIREEGERLDRYIQNLLDMTRLGHGQLPLNRDWICVDELIGSVVTRMKRYRMEAPIRVSISPDIGPIWVHPALVEQALFNVIENAAKFSPAGEPIDIDAELVAEKCLQIDIRDSGPGIPDADRSRIFDMFYSVERGDRGCKGTGLGLAICQGMIGAHGGNVEALPGANGTGTTIRITLPLVAATPQSDP